MRKDQSFTVFFLALSDVISFVSKSSRLLFIVNKLLKTAKNHGSKEQKADTVRSCMKHKQKK